MNDGHLESADCTETIYRIYEYLDGEMTPDDTRRIALHIQECAPCLAQADIDHAIKALVRRSCQCETAPESLRVTIMERLTQVRFSFE